MQRVLVYAHDDQPLFELSPLEVFVLDRKEAINGEHALSIRTTRVLEKGQRVLTLDNRGRWREHVVYGTDEAHESGQRPIGEYYCVWSLMHDLMGTTVSRMPGVQTPVVAEVALEAALSGTSRWEVGTVTNSTLGGASMYDMGGWEAMQVMTKTWGGEVDVTIEVGLAGVVSRKVDYYDAQGEHVAKRRFDFGADLKGVRRKIPDGPIFCRISPRGKGEQTEGGGYGRKITIESVNDGKDWLQNDQLAPLVALPDGNGGWEYPKRIVENSQIETPAELKEWGLSVLEEYTVPKVSYEVDAVQVAIEGVDVQGVSLGDQVHVVDGRFGGLRLTARVVSIETDMLDELSVKVKLGYIGENVGTMFTKLQGDIASVSAAIEAVRSGTEMTDTYLQRLVARLNQEINATGGYWYLIEGLGTRTYDTAVSDPAVGAEATKVIEMRGGSLRIADSKDAQGNWEWDTVFVSGHVAAQLITAAHLETGYIGSPTSGNYWNLDTGEFQMAATSTLGTKTVQQIIDGIDATITDTDMEYAQGTSPTQAPQTGWQTQPPAWEAGKYIWQRLKTTTAAGVSYSDPVMISGRDGADGTSVTIKGSYNTLAELQAAHPTGQDGDAYMVGTDLYVWNGSAWEDVGQIQGPQGPAGTSVTVSSIQYGTSTSASTQPSSWSTTAPTSITKGRWLWVRTNYSNGSSSITKSYVGTDGDDGTSIYVTSSTKTGGVTTVRLSDGTTLTINDGEDGATGQQGPVGANGESNYIHTAWANSADGTTDFSTTVSAGKSYLGVCTDQNTADPSTPSSYSWSKIEGDAGADGVGISSIQEQFARSTSTTPPAKTSTLWQDDQPSYQSGYYYFSRSKITWENGAVDYTDGILARAITSANQNAAAAQATANSAQSTANSAQAAANTANNTLATLNTQEGIFNKLTNNGALQGLYMSNGQLYINGTYIKAGYIGNADSTSYWDLADGTIVIVNATKNQWNYNELLEFGQTGITDSSGWLNTITSAQTVAGLRLGSNRANAYSGYGAIQLIPNLPASSDANPASISAIASRFALKLLSNSGLVAGDTSSRYKSGISLNSQYIELNTMYGSTVYPGIIIGRNGYVYLFAKRSDYTLNNGSTASSIDSTMYVTSSGATLNGNVYVHLDSTHLVQATATSGVRIGESSSSRYVNLLVYGTGTFQNGIVVPKNKSRLVETEHYNDRLLYCDETPSPTFTDFGSGRTDEDGICYVEIDDVFSETVRTDMAYQVFLQACGRGELWVEEKTPTHFIVHGAPNLAFDWQLKAHQMGFEYDHLETYSMQTINEETAIDAYQTWADTIYDTDLDYAARIEALYEQEETNEAA